MKIDKEASKKLGVTVMRSSAAKEAMLEVRNAKKGKKVSDSELSLDSSETNETFLRDE